LRPADINHDYEGLRSRSSVRRVRDRPCRMTPLRGKSASSIVSSK